MIHDTSYNWKYTTDRLHIGGRLIKEVYVGDTKVYPTGVNLMRLREIVEDDARYYGDAGGRKYNWYVWFEDSETYDTFGTGDRGLIVYIFCDWHAPHNGEYYGKDLSKPVGFTNWGDTPSRDGTPVPAMRIIYYKASTAEKTEKSAGSIFYPYTIPVNPEWKQGDGEGRYNTPGNEIIWFGWSWWIFKDSKRIFKYDFVKREFGPELRGADLWYPEEPDEEPNLT